MKVPPNKQGEKSKLICVNWEYGQNTLICPCLRIQTQNIQKSIAKASILKIWKVLPVPLTTALPCWMKKMNEKKVYAN